MYLFFLSYCIVFVLMLCIYEKLKFPFIRSYKYFLFYLVNGENIAINTNFKKIRLIVYFCYLMTNNK